MIKKIEAYETSQGDICKTLEIAVICEIRALTGLLTGDVAPIIENRALIVPLLQSLDREPETGEKQGPFTPWTQDVIDAVPSGHEWVAYDVDGRAYAFDGRPRFCRDGIWRLPGPPFPKPINEVAPALPKYIKAENAVFPRPGSLAAHGERIDWSGICANYRWVAYDGNGDVYAHWLKPTWFAGVWGRSGNNSVAITAPALPEGIDPKDALFERPGRDA